MKKYFNRIIVIALVCVLILAMLNMLFKSDKKHYSGMMMWDMYHAQENIDIVFLGSSHVYQSYDAEMADDIFGRNTFNAGSSGQLLDQSYFLMKEICKRNQVKTIYLDTTFLISRIKSSQNEESVFYISDYAKWSIDKIIYLYESGGLKTLCEGALSVKRSLANWDAANFGEYRGDGFVYCKETLSPEKVDFESYEDINLNSELPMSEFSYKYLKKIIDYCQENEIELVLVDQPMLRDMVENVNGYSNYVDFMYKICRENQLIYLNFNLYKGEIGLTMEDYYDEHHLNGSGAEKYTKVFCNTVKQIEEDPAAIDRLFDAACFKDPAG